jgi:hypothetical protein
MSQTFSRVKEVDLMKRMTVITLVVGVAGAAGAGVLAPRGGAPPATPDLRGFTIPPAIPDLRGFTLPSTPVPQVLPRTEFHTDMPMDLVRIITPDAPSGGALPPMPRAEVRIVAPDARVRDYFTQMPIISGGLRPGRVGEPRPWLPSPRGR